MSVDPVQSNSARIENQAPAKKAHAVPPSPIAVVDNGPKTDSVTTKSTESSAVPLLIPEHEVKVVVDTPPDGILIYQFLDKQSGNLVLQVPSEGQVRGIHQTQELLQQIANRGKTSIQEAASTAVVTGKGNSNGGR
jgi:hypothetical protein